MPGTPGASRAGARGWPRWPRTRRASCTPVSPGSTRTGPIRADARASSLAARARRCLPRSRAASCSSGPVRRRRDPRVRVTPARLRESIRMMRARDDDRARFGERTAADVAAHASRSRRSSAPRRRPLSRGRACRGCRCAMTRALRRDRLPRAARACRSASKRTPNGGLRPRAGRRPSALSATRPRPSTARGSSVRPDPPPSCPGRWPRRPRAEAPAKSFPGPLERRPVCPGIKMRLP